MLNNKKIPDCGGLWVERGTVCRLIVLGNNTAEDNTIWCADEITGERFDPAISRLGFVGRLSLLEVSAKCRKWARAGNHHAAWWLGWYYEGTNHPKSVWYYIAALRLRPEHYFRAVSRIYSDSLNTHTGSGVPAPSLEFLKNIDEFSQIEKFMREGFLSNAEDADLSRIVWGNHLDALLNAENAEHLLLPR